MMEIRGAGQQRRQHDPSVQVSVEEPPVFTFLLVKLAQRCNIACTYC